jgi:hypothetical protein
LFAPLQVGGLGLIVLSLWVAVLAYRERRRWLLTWAGVYFTVAITMTSLTYSKGPDPHDMFGCRRAQPPFSRSLPPRLQASALRLSYL